MSEQIWFVFRRENELVQIWRTYLEDGSKTTIGRGSNMIVSIQEMTLSRHHATVVVQNGKLVYTDEGSLNGSLDLKGNVKITIAELHVGDKIRMGGRVTMEVTNIEPTGETKERTAQLEE